MGGCVLCSSGCQVDMQRQSGGGMLARHANFASFAVAIHNLVAVLSVAAHRVVVPTATRYVVLAEAHRVLPSGAKLSRS